MPAKTFATDILPYVVYVWKIGILIEIEIAASAMCFLQ